MMADWSTLCPHGMSRVTTTGRVCPHCVEQARRERMEERFIEVIEKFATTLELLAAPRVFSKPFAQSMYSRGPAELCDCDLYGVVHARQAECPVEAKEPVARAPGSP